MAFIGGLLFSRWPTVWTLYFVFIWILVESRRQIFWVLLFGALGAMRGTLFFETLKKSKLNSKIHLYEIEVESVRKFFAFARVVTEDLEAVENYIARIEGRYRVGERVIGVGQLKSYHTKHSRGVLSPQEELLAENIQGKIKWSEPPRIISINYSQRDQWRTKIFKKIKTRYEPLNSLRRALVLGDGSGLPQSVWKSFNATGLSHILVISGSHLSAIIAITWFLFHFIFGWVGAGIKSLRWACFGVIGLFFFVCNQEVSLVRSLLSFVLVSAMGGLWPAVHRFKASERLAMIGILILLISPIEVFRPTYALSFGATWALLCSWRSSYWLDSFMVFFVIHPLCLLFGMSVHWLSPLINLAFLPPFLFAITPLSIFSVFLRFLEPVGNYFSQFYLDAVRFVAHFLGSDACVGFKPQLAGLLLVATLALFTTKKLSRAHKWLSVLLIQTLTLSLQLGSK